MMRSWIGLNNKIEIEIYRNRNQYRKAERNKIIKQRIM